MAITPADNEVFYREVDEELRREQLAEFGKRYGLAIIVGVILLIAAIGAGFYWAHHRSEVAGERGEALTKALDDVQAGQIKKAQPVLDTLVAEGGDGYRAAALLTKADIAVQQGKDAEAAAGYKAVAEDKGFAQPYRDLALVRQTAVEFDTLAPDAVIARLKPLAVAGNPWFGSAGEMVALAHMKQGKPQLAAPIFAALAKDQTVPQSIRARAIQMAGALGVDAIQDSEATDDKAPAKEGTE